jgi:hypothetical protein
MELLSTTPRSTFLAQSLPDSLSPPFPHLGLPFRSRTAAAAGELFLFEGYYVHELCKQRSI